MHDRFWRKVHKTEKCWLWTAGKNQYGYGLLGAKIKNVDTTSAHRIAYILTVGEIPKGLVIDHLCRVRHCVNPEHLEVVTQAENIKRGNTGLARSLQQLSKPHCTRGHELTKENTWRVKPTQKKNSSRRCKICRKADYIRGNTKYRLKQEALKCY